MLNSLKNKISKLWGLLFKKKPPVLLPKTPEELAKEKIRKRYRLEYLETLGVYFVQFEYNGEWLYLRRWDDDYTFETVRGNAIQLRNPEMINEVIDRHQEWFKGGKIFLL
jgi:hypothetical protein